PRLSHWAFAYSVFLRSTVSRLEASSVRSVRGLRCSVARGSRNSRFVMEENYTIRLRLRKLLVVCLATTAIACGGTRPGATPAPARAARGAPVIRGAPLIPPTWSLRARGVTAPHAMVVSAHPLASQV